MPVYETVKPELPELHIFQQLQPGTFFCNIDEGFSIVAAHTASGVYRYDGTSATHFTAKDDLCYNNITCIMEDKSGNIWFGSTFKKIWAG